MGTSWLITFPCGSCFANLIICNNIQGYKHITKFANPINEIKFFFRILWNHFRYIKSFFLELSKFVWRNVNCDLIKLVAIAIGNLSCSQLDTQRLDHYWKDKCCLTMGCQEVFTKYESITIDHPWRLTLEDDWLSPRQFVNSCVRSIWYFL